MKRLMTLLAIAAFAIAPATWAQEAAATPEATQVQAQAKGAEQSLTGCLSESNGAFMLKTSTGEVALEGDLAAHTGKTIRVTGTMTQKDGKSVLKVATAEVVSPRCQA